ncbi:MAG: VOC family protein [Anaerolineae bacterium]
MVAFKRVFAVVPAHDLARVRDFYEGVLGLTAEPVTTDGVLYALGDSRLFLYPTASAGTGGHTVASFEVEDIHAAMADLRGHGVVFEEYDVPGLKTVQGVAELEGELAAWFCDSEGNIVAIGQLR